MSLATPLAYSCSAWRRDDDDSPSPLSPSAVGHRSIPVESVIVTCDASSPLTLEATRCEMPRIVAASRSLAVSRTAALAFAPLSAKSESSGNTSCTSALRTPSICSIVRATSPSSARWKSTFCWKSVAPRLFLSKIS